MFFSPSKLLFPCRVDTNGHDIQDGTESSKSTELNSKTFQLEEDLLSFTSLTWSFSSWLFSKGQSQAFTAGPAKKCICLFYCFYSSRYFQK